MAVVIGRCHKYALFLRFFRDSERFYEKVIKVKADVAAFFIFFSSRILEFAFLFFPELLSFFKVDLLIHCDLHRRVP
jgi:hypothetical protein